MVWGFPAYHDEDDGNHPQDDVDANGDYVKDVDGDHDEDVVDEDGINLACVYDDLLDSVSSVGIPVVGCQPLPPPVTHLLRQVQARPGHSALYRRKKGESPVE